ncbi:MAG: ROK family protein [Acidobacteriales bacterium]|nr:ROK family protein [Terriglobales bacterium]
MPDYSIGVDLGGTNLRIAALNQAGELLEKITLGTRVAMGRDTVINDMCAAIRLMVDRHASDELQGIGIGVPGIIDMRTGLLRESPNLPGWEDYPVRNEIEQRLHTRVILENDANSAAMGEKWLGAGRNYDDMLMITLGTGVGGGVILNGRIWHGMNGMAGELGHINIEAEGPPCGCGSRGCVEQYASATAVVRMAREAIAEGAPGLARAEQSGTEFSAAAIYNLAVQGDEDARRIFRRVGSSLGIVLAGLVNSLNLPMHVIGGGVASAWDAFAPTIFEELRQRSMVYAATAPAAHFIGTAGASGQVEPTGAYRTIITRALLGSDAGLFGAARLAMDASISAGSGS